jgi:hypothetical protein
VYEQLQKHAVIPGAGELMSTQLERMQVIFDDEYLDIITVKDVEIETKSSSHMKTDRGDTVIKGRLSETKIRNAKEGLQGLRGTSGFPSNIWGVRFFVDLNDFNGVLDGRIDSVLTVTPMHPSGVRTPSPCLYIKVFVHIHLEADNLRTTIPLGDSYEHISSY